MENIFIRTKDGYPISIHVFSPNVSNNKILVINSATGVKQQLYFGFLESMATIWLALLQHLFLLEI